MGSITEYLGYTVSLKEAYILTLIITFITAMVFLHFIFKTKTKRR